MNPSDNYGKVAQVIVSWLKPRAMALVKQQKPVETINEYLRSSGYLRNFINFFGIDLMNYNVVDELGFLIEPLLKRFGLPQLVDGLKKIAPEEEILPAVKEIVDSAMNQAAQKTGKNVNIFGITVDLLALSELKAGLDNVE